MKVKVNLENGETLEQAEENLLKALKSKEKAKSEVSERYADDMINDFHDFVMNEHDKVLNDIKGKIKTEVSKVVSS